MRRVLPPFGTSRAPPPPSLFMPRCRPPNVHLACMRSNGLHRRGVDRPTGSGCRSHCEVGKSTSRCRPPVQGSGDDGASGLVPCGVLCNVVARPQAADEERGIASLAARSDMLADVSCPDLDVIGRRSDEDVWGLADRLRQHRSSPSTLKMKEQCCGICYHDRGLLFADGLRPHVLPASCTRVDPMHVVFSNGILNTEIALILNRAKQHHGVKFSHLREYLAGWKFAFFVKRQSQPADLFNTAREKKCDEALKVESSILKRVRKRRQREGEREREKNEQTKKTKI